MSNNEKIRRLVELEFSDLEEEEDVTPEVQARVEEYRDSLEGLSATELDRRIEAAEARALRDLRQLYRTLQDEHLAQQERRKLGTTCYAARVAQRTGPGCCNSF